MISREAQEIDYLPFRDEEYLRDPYSFYAVLRERRPVYRHPDGFWVLTRHADVTRLLHDRSLAVGAIDFGTAAPLHRSVLGSDPPDHTRLRRRMARWFTPRMVAEWRRIAEDELDRRIDELVVGGAPFDAVDDLAYPVTFAIISRILGVPEGDALRIRRTTIEIGSGLGAAPPTEAESAQATAAFHWLMAHADVLVRHKEAEPGEGLIDDLLAAEREGVMTREETIAQIVLLFAVGHLDVVYLIVNGIRLMTEHPAIARAYREAPGERDRIVAEMLRLDTPEHFVSRLTTRDTVVSGTTIPAGELVLLFLGAANRDPEAFVDPDAFDARREAPAGGHVAFGGGVHGCVGQILARAEADVFFTALTTRFARIVAAGEPEYAHSDINRAITHLPVRAEGAPEAAPAASEPDRRARR